MTLTVKGVGAWWEGLKQRAGGLPNSGAHRPAGVAGKGSWLTASQVLGGRPGSGEGLPPSGQASFLLSLLAGSLQAWGARALRRGLLGLLWGKPLDAG